MKYLGTIVKLVLMSLLALQFSGCASQIVDTNRYFWPPLPDVPRIEWLGTYGTDADIKPPSFFEKIVGKDIQVALDRPLYIAADGMGKVYVTDQAVGGAVLFDLKAQEAKVFTEKAGPFGRPSGVAIDGEGDVYVGDSHFKRITVFSKDGNVKKVLDLSKDVKNIGSFAIDRVRKRLVVPDIWGHQIAVFDLDGKLLQVVGKRGIGNAEFNYPTSVAIDKEGNIVVCDSMNARIQRLSPDLKFLSKFGQRGDGLGEFSIIKAVALDSEGHIYVTDGKGHKVSIFNEQGEVLLSLGGPYTASPGVSIAPGGFLLPQGIYIDDNDTIYVVEQMNSRIQIFQYMTEKYQKEHPISAQKRN